MARKNGIGPTSGKVATTYTAIAPDGTELRKRSFFVNSESAFIMVYIHNDKWYPATVTESVRADLAHLTPCAAKILSVS